ncbi:hypothetical protein Bhyg_08107, partial [Pseudolycoriella hygida]
MQVTSMWTMQKVSPWHWREAILTLIGQVENYDDWDGCLHERCNMLCHKFLNLCTPVAIDPRFDEEEYYMGMTVAATPPAARSEENVTSDAAITAITEPHAGPQKAPDVEVVAHLTQDLERELDIKRENLIQTLSTSTDIDTDKEVEDRDQKLIF